MQRRGKKTDPNSFARRHIGPSEDEVGGMLREVGFESLNTPFQRISDWIEN